MAQTGKPSKPKPVAKKPVKTARKPAAQKTARKASKPDEPPEEIRYCSFCGKPSTECHFLVVGMSPANANICDECIEVCLKIFIEELPSYWYHRLLLLLGQIKVDKKQSFEKKQKQPKAKKGKES